MNAQIKFTSSVQSDLIKCSSFQINYRTSVYGMGVNLTTKPGCAISHIQLFDSEVHC
jgi:hypothetical protein